MSLKPFLAGKVAVVTGAGRGLGAAAAESLAEAGAATVLVARTTEQIQAIARRIGDSGGEALPVAADIAVPEEVEHLVSEALRLFGRIDFVINIAGTIEGLGKPGWELEPEEWRLLTETNITGPYMLCRAMVPVMLNKGSGRILMLTSSSAERPTPAAAPYGASKSAVNQLVRALALELEEKGVNINAFNPGPIKSPTLERVKASLSAGPWRRYWGGATRSPEQAARLILWLCSPETAQLNGEVIYWNDPSTQAGVAHFEREYQAPAGS